MKRVYVSGASGFVGSAVIRELRKRGIDTITERVDLFEAQAVHGFLVKHRPTHLLHLAWYAKPVQFWTSPENVAWAAASLRLVQAFIETGGRTIVSAGTCAEYRWDGSLCIEDITPLEPATLYGSAKNGFARIAATYCAQAACSFAHGRIFFVYGPGEPREKMISSMIDDATATGTIRLRDPARRIDAIHVDDVARAFAVLLEQSPTGSFNLGSGVASRMTDIASTVAARLGATVEIETQGAQGSFDVVADTRKMRALGWECTIGLPEGVATVLASE